jgi:hypothetical protein
VWSRKGEYSGILFATIVDALDALCSNHPANAVHNRQSIPSNNLICGFSLLHISSDHTWKKRQMQMNNCSQSPKAAALNFCWRYSRRLIFLREVIVGRRELTTVCRLLKFEPQEEGDRITYP